MKKNEAARCDKIQNILADINLHLIKPLPLFDTWFYIKFYKKMPKERVHTFLISLKDYQKIKALPHRPLKESYLTGLRYRNIDFILDYNGYDYKNLVKETENVIHFRMLPKPKMYEILMMALIKQKNNVHLNQLSFFLLSNIL